MLKLNDEEVALLRDYVGGEEDVDAFLTGIFARFDLQCVILTLGEQGCRVVSKEGDFSGGGAKTTGREYSGCWRCFYGGLCRAFTRWRTDADMRRASQCRWRFCHDTGWRDAAVARAFSGFL